MATTSFTLLGHDILYASCSEGGASDACWRGVEERKWPDNLAPGAGDTLVFAGTTQTTTINDYTAGTSFAGITMDTTATSPFTFNGNKIALTGNVTNSVTPSAVTTTFNAAIDLGSASRTFSTVATFGSSVVAFQFNGVISGSGGITKSGQGKLVLANTANTFTGVINSAVTGGTIDYYSVANEGATGGVASSLGASSNAASNLVLGGTNATFRYSGSATASTDRLFTLNAALSFINDGAGVLTWSNASAMLQNNSTKILSIGGSNAGDNTFALLLQDAKTQYGTGTNTLALSKTSVGTWVVTNSSSSYTGITTIQGGVLKVTSLANGGSNSSIGAAGTAAANLVFGVAGANSSAGALVYTGTTDASTDRLFSIVNTSFSNKLASSGTGTVHFLNIGAITYGVADAARSFTFGGTNTGNNTFDPLIGNNGTGATSITKADAGKWILTGTNTYTGATTISSGTLLINGSLASGSAVSLAAATLGGSGAVNGTVTTAGTASVISPGNGPGTTLMLGALNAASGADFVFQLGTSQTALAISGLITGSTAAGGLKFDFSNAGGLVGYTPYTIINFGSVSGLNYTDFSVNSLPAGYTMDTAFGGGGNGFQINATSLQVQLVPEPAAWALLAAAGSFFMVMRRRRG